MTDSLSAQPHARLFALPAPERYTHFLTQAQSQRQVWTLHSDAGFVSFSDEDGTPCFPFWSSAEQAQALAEEDWSDCRPEPLALTDFMERWLPGLERDERLVSVCPAPDGSGMVVDPRSLLDDLHDEASQLDSNA
ncbi:MAG: DUF2750 domain-containing protein [Chromatiaceae bacterium]|nr:DUF2750 domain-containing protein [Chromatiaceae bacterium]